MEKLRGDRSADLSALEGREWDAVLDVAAYFPDEVRRSVEVLQGTSAATCSSPASPSTRTRACRRWKAPPWQSCHPGREATKGRRRTAPARLRASGSSWRRSATRRSSCGRASSSGRTIRRAASRTGRTASREAARCSPRARPTTRCSSSTSAISRRGWCRRPRVAGRDVQRHGRADALGDLLEECRAVAGSDAAFTWVDERAAAGRGGAGRGWSCRCGCRSPNTPASAASVDGRVAAGLTYRPLADTIRGTLDQARAVDGVGLTPERERELLSLS